MIDVTNYGAAGDGSSDDTAALRAALSDAARSGGGVVRVPAGTYLTGPLRLKDGVELHLEDAAVLSFIPDFERYEPVFTRWEGVECWALHPFVFADGAKNIALTGSGTLDGNGRVWWDAYRAARAAGQKEPATEQQKLLASLNPGYRHHPSGGGGRETQFLRPPLVQFINCSGVRIEGLKHTNSAFWNTHLVYCADVSIRRVLFKNPSDAANTDGLDIDSCSDVTIEDCDFDVGDDCLCLKSGSGEDGVRVNRPTERVTIRNCVMRAGHGGLVIGSETAGGVRDVEVSGCSFIGTDRGLRLKTRRGRGGTVENVALSDCTMRDVICPVVVNMYYGPGGPAPDSPVFSLEAQPVTATTPRIRNISVKRLRAEGCRSAAGFAVGLPEAPIENLRISDSSFVLAVPPTAPVEEAAMTRGLPAPAGRGFRLRNVAGARIEGLRIEPESEGVLSVETNVELI